MPFVNVKITREGATPEQKSAIIKGVTDVLQNVLGKHPDTTYVIIDEVALEDWGVSGMSVAEKRKLKAK